MRVKNLLICFFCVFGTSLFAQTTSLKHYSDELQNFDGWANAVFEESIKGSEYENNADLVIEAISKKLSEKFTPVYKMTKNNMWLCKQALNECETEKGEIYRITCANSEKAIDSIMVYAIIKDNAEFSWCAFSVSFFDLLKNLSANED